MVIDSTAKKSDETATSGALHEKTGTDRPAAAPTMHDSQELLLRAQKNAEEAKRAAMGAINRFYQESQASEKKAEKMVRDLDEAIESALLATQKSAAKDKKLMAGLDKGWPGAMDKKSKVSKKVLNGGVFSLFGNGKEYDAETREEFYQLVMRQSPQLRQLIDDLTEDKARIKTEKIMAEAKSEIIAARVAVNRAQEETASVKEDVKRSLADAESAKKTAEVIISQVRQSAVTQIADEITRSKDEVRAIKEAADIALQRAQEEVKKSREQAEAANNHAQVAVSLAQEKVKKESDQARAARLQAEIIVKQAQEEARMEKDQAEIMRRQAQEAVNRATLETQSAKEALEQAKKIAQEATVSAEKKAYEKFCEEIKKIRADAELASKSAYDAITRAREETRLAREETATMKRTCEESIIQAQQEVDRAKADEERAKQALLDAIAQAEENSRKASEEAEVSIMKANQAMMEAKQEIINLTRNEISKARQSLEGAGSFDETPENLEGRVDSGYVASVLHEMRAPLHSISGFAKLMLEDGVKDGMTQKEFLSLMVQQSESLNRLIDDLSGILSEKSSGFSVHKAPVPAQKLITEAVNSVQGMAGQKKNLISHTISSSLPEINADEGRVKQVIVNLLHNAIKFSPDESIIYVKASVVGTDLLVQVIDRGRGMTEAELKELFNQPITMKKSEMSGDGLGLYICRQIIEAHGGNIWAESVEGKGSTFSFTLPLP